MSIKNLIDTAITVPVNIAQLISDTDFKTIDEGIAYNESGMDLVWNFETKAGVITQTEVTPTTGGDYDWTHIGNGLYKIEIPADSGASANNDTEGYGWFSGVCDGVLPFIGPKIHLAPANIVNSLVDGTDYLHVDAIESNIIDVTPWVPTAIDLSDATVALGLTFTCSRGAVPTTGEMTSGNITIKRKPIGSASWLTVVNSGGCNKAAGRIYYNEVFNAGATYAEGDAIEILFSGQSILVDGKTYTISSSQHYGYIRSASAGANITSINGVAQRATDLAEISRYLLANSLTLTDVIADNSIFAQFLASNGIISGYSKVDDALQSIRDAITASNPINHSALSNAETTGTLDSGTYADTATVNTTYYQTSPVTPAVGGFGLNVELGFNIGIGRVPSQVTVTGYFNSGALRTVQVWFYDYNLADWVQVSSSVNDFGNKVSNETFQYSLTQNMVQASDGEVKIRFTSTSITTGDDFYCDYIDLTSIQQAGGGLTADSIQTAVWARQDSGHDEDTLGYNLSKIHVLNGDIVSATNANQFIIDGDITADDSLNGMLIMLEDKTDDHYELRRIVDSISSTNEIFLDRDLGFTPVALDDYYIMSTGYACVNVDKIVDIVPSTYIGTSVWNYLTAAMTTVNSIGKKVADWVLGSDDKVILSNNAHTGAVIPVVTAITDRVTANTDQIEGSDATDQIRDSVLDDATRFSGTNIDATISSRSSHTAANVWSVSVRTLSSYGTLVADIATAVWGAAIKILSAATNITSDGATIDQTRIANLDATVSSRSSHTAANVWAVSVRTLSTYGTLVADIATAVWAAGVRTLTSTGTLVADTATAVWAYVTRTLTGGGDATEAKQDLIITDLTEMKGAGWVDENLKDIQDSIDLITGDATAANQTAIINHLIAMKGAGWVNENLKEIQDTINAVAGLSGSNVITITVQDQDANHIVECAVEIWDEAGTTFYERKSTDSNGQITINADDGTYIVRLHKASYTFTDQTLIVVATAGVTYTGTAFVAPVTSAPDACTVWDKFYTVAADGFASTVTGTAKIISLPYDSGDGLHPGTIITGVYVAVTGIMTWNIVRGARVQFLVSTPDYDVDKICVVPEQASARLTDIE